MKTETMTLDGRQFCGFSAGSIAAQQDEYVLGHLRSAIAAEGLRGPGGVRRTKEERTETLLTQILLSGRTHNVLAGILVEKGRAWNRRDADANALRFAAITDVDEKTAMRVCLRNFVIGYCLFAGQASASSLQ